jgi:hypothetical protein
VKSVLNHIEKKLACLDGAWSEERDGTPLPFKILLFRNQPSDGLITFVTLGISEALLPLGAGRRIRQELVFSAHDRFRLWNMAGLVSQIGKELLQTNRPLLRGQVLEPAGSILPGATLDAIYCSIPVFFPQSFHQCNTTEPPTVFVWCIPIAASEAHLVRTTGWNYFEEQLEKSDPDLFDLQRTPILTSDVDRSRSKA